MTDTVPATSDQAPLADRLREVLTAAPKPMTAAEVLKKVSKQYPKGTKKAPAPPKPTDAEIQQELEAAVGRKDLFKYPPLKGKEDVRYGSSQPPEAVVRDLVLATLRTGAGPFTAAELAEQPSTLKPADFKKTLAAVLGELIVEGKLFAHGTGKTTRYATFAEPPRLSAEEVVRSLVLTTLDTKSGPFKDKQLATKPPTLKPPAFKQALATVIRDLVAEGKLFEHPGKTKRYGTEPHKEAAWHESAPFAKPYKAVVTAANKLLTLEGVTADQLVAALRVSLKLDVLVPEREAEKRKPEAAGQQTTTDKQETPDLRTALKAAYDYLCDFVEFRDRVVELRRLYHETAKRFPGLSVAQFHDELWDLSKQHRIELHPINEVIQAKERHLAIERDGSLLYYARWK